MTGRTLLLAVAAAAALAAVAAASAIAQGGARTAGRSPLPSALNPGGAGLGAPFAFLQAAGRAPLRLETAGSSPPPAAVVILAAPSTPLDEAEVSALLAGAEAGGLLVWALGGGDQPALERRLALRRLGSGPARPLALLAPHPLLRGLSLRAGPAAVVSDLPGAVPLLGSVERPAALSIPAGAGEVLVLASPELLDGAHLAELDHLSLWTRLAARGRIVFDERHLLASGSATRPAVRALELLAAQALLAALAWLALAGRRLGAVRPPPASGAGRTARDYLASLAALYRRTGADAALAEGSWRRCRRALERTAGIGARLAPEAAASRLERRSAAAAEALRRGEAALARGGPDALLEVTRAAAELEGALRHPARSRRGGV